MKSIFIQTHVGCSSLCLKSNLQWICSSRETSSSFHIARLCLYRAASVLFSVGFLCFFVKKKSRGLKYTLLVPARGSAVGVGSVTCHGVRVAASPAPQAVLSITAGAWLR